MNGQQFETRQVTTINGSLFTLYFQKWNSSLRIENTFKVLCKQKHTIWKCNSIILRREWKEKCDYKQEFCNYWTPSFQLSAHIKSAANCVFGSKMILQYSTLAAAFVFGAIVVAGDYQYKIQSYEVPLDHFNFVSNRTFKIRWVWFCWIAKSTTKDRTTDR